LLRSVFAPTQAVLPLSAPFWADGASESSSASARSAEALRTSLAFFGGPTGSVGLSERRRRFLASSSSSEGVIRLVGGRGLADGRLAFSSRAFASRDFFYSSRALASRDFCFTLAGSSASRDFSFFLAALRPRGIRSFFSPRGLFRLTGFLLFIFFFCSFVYFSNDVSSEERRATTRLRTKISRPVRASEGGGR